MAETTKQTTKPRTQTAAKTAEKKVEVEEKKETLYTEDDVKKIVSDAIESFKKTLPQKSESENKYVTMMYLGSIASHTTVSLGKLGSFTKAGVPRNFPKELFLECLGRPVIDELLSTRHLIVLDGLTKDERERYGLDYKEGEILSRNAFFKLLDYGKNEICDIFAQMCVEHKRLISKVYHAAYFEEHDKRINTETVKALNDISKSYDKSGMFTLILEDMGRKLAE